MSEICLAASAWEFIPEREDCDIHAEGAQQTDAILAQRLRARDPQALTALYDRYGRIAYAVVFRAVRDAAVAEDLVQETFLRVWTRAGSFDPQRGALGTWITAMARYRAIDYLRSMDARMAANAVELHDTECPSAIAGSGNPALSIDRKRCLDEAFRKLTPSQRELIHLAYYEGLSQTEMASRLKQPLGTIKTWVRAALRTLREELA